MKRVNRRPSLNKMVMESLSELRQETKREAFTARAIKDSIIKRYDIDYPIQTIIVVLNRFMTKGQVGRITYAGREVRQRYAYYLKTPASKLEERRMWERLQAFADEFYGGDVRQAVEGAQALLDRIEGQSLSLNGG